jgi:hypothetical protein
MLNDNVDETTGELMDGECQEVGRFSLRATTDRLVLTQEHVVRTTVSQRRYCIVYLYLFIAVPMTERQKKRFMYLLF